jgi:hypothetical protein
VATESGGPDPRDVWQAQTEMEPRMSMDEIRGKIRSIEKEGRRRSVAMVVSGGVIVPSWLAVAWYLPDFRLLATVGVATALWIVYHAHRNIAARRLAVGVTSSPSLPFYRQILQRELDWHRGLPVWFLPPAALSTAAIALTFYNSARFAHTPVFFAMMAWIVGGAAVALVIGFKRSRREADRCRRELDTLGN